MNETLILCFVRQIKPMLVLIVHLINHDTILYEIINLIIGIVSVTNIFLIDEGVWQGLDKPQLVSDAQIMMTMTLVDIDGVVAAINLVATK
jgi:hypothetical protein